MLIRDRQDDIFYLTVYWALESESYKNTNWIVSKTKLGRTAPADRLRLQILNTNYEWFVKTERGQTAPADQLRLQIVLIRMGYPPSVKATILVWPAN